ncbi:MAG: hypothetical protein FWG87_12040 [Defluviitaleaceae bacterium]|nr:hypothetical protein [Defluviitaleaceae bacterium]
MERRFSGFSRILSGVFLIRVNPRSIALKSHLIQGSCRHSHQATTAKRGYAPS